MTTLSADATRFTRHLDDLATGVPGLRHALLVSADGLPLAMSDDLDRTGGDQLATVVAGLAGLTRGAARQLGCGTVRQSVVEMDTGFLFLMSVRDGSVLAVLADDSSDAGTVGYEMALLVGRAEATLTPALAGELRGRRPVDLTSAG